MIFLRLYSVTILLILIILFVWFNQQLIQWMSATPYFGFISFFILLFIYFVSTYFKVKDDKLSKYIFFFKTSEVPISSIKLIQAVTVKKFGYIHIYIASNSEDYYDIHLRNGGEIKVDAYYSRNGSTLGRFLSKQYRIKFAEVEKMKYLNS